MADQIVEDLVVLRPERGHREQHLEALGAGVDAPGFTAARDRGVAIPGEVLPQRAAQAVGKIVILVLGEQRVASAEEGVHRHLRENPRHVDVLRNVGSQVRSRTGILIIEGHIAEVLERRAVLATHGPVLQLARGPADAGFLVQPGLPIEPQVPVLQEALIALLHIDVDPGVDAVDLQTHPRAVAGLIAIAENARGHALHEPRKALRDDPGIVTVLEAQLLEIVPVLAQHQLVDVDLEGDLSEATDLVQRIG